MTKSKKLPECIIEKAEFNFMLDLKTHISKKVIDPEMTTVRASMRREERDTAPEGYRSVFDRLLTRWGLVFVGDQIALPFDLRRRVMDILHFGHPGTKRCYLTQNFLVVGDAGVHGSKIRRFHRLPRHR